MFIFSKFYIYITESDINFASLSIISGSLCSYLDRDNANPPGCLKYLQNLVAWMVKHEAKRLLPANVWLYNLCLIDINSRVSPGAKGGTLLWPTCLTTATPPYNPWSIEFSERCSLTMLALSLTTGHTFLTIPLIPPPPTFHLPNLYNTLQLIYPFQNTLSYSHYSRTPSHIPPHSRTPSPTPPHSKTPSPTPPILEHHPLLPPF